MNTKFWRGKKVFLTGHSGFKGSWCAMLLNRLGSSVYGYSIGIPTRPSLFEVAKVKGIASSMWGDIRDLNRLSADIDKVRPQIVIHMAAQPLVRRSYSIPIETLDVNIMGTANILEAVRRTASVRAAVIVTTDKCYENREWLWPYREEDRLGGEDPYSSSKACAEIITNAYRSSFFMRHGNGRKRLACVATARAGNVIGGGDWSKDRLIPDAVTAYMSGKPLVVRNPMSVRPWQNVLDPLNGYLLLAEKLFERDSAIEGAWNFGPSYVNSRSASWMADATVKRWGRGAHWKQGKGSQLHESRQLRLDSSKARYALGWNPHLSLLEGLGYAIDWYKAYQSGKDMRRFSYRQIDSYLKLVSVGRNDALE